MITFNRINQQILALCLCSLLLLIIVFYFEHVLGLIPCKLCIWQRLPHFAVVVLGVLMLFKNKYNLTICLMCTITITAGLVLSGYHVGIEYKIWPGPSSCSGGNILNKEDSEVFLEALLNTSIVKCDEVPWSFLMISMAGWNFIISMLLSIFWSVITLYVLRSKNIQQSNSASQ